MVGRTGRRDRRSGRGSAGRPDPGGPGRPDPDRHRDAGLIAYGRPMATQSSGPLAGIRVLELGGIGPGPMAAMVLADLGAEVVRVERPGGDGSLVPPEHMLLHRGRRSVIVDLRHPRGGEVIKRLAAVADVVIEGFRPGVTERLGVGPEDLFAVNPRLVYGRVTGWGQEGPLAHTAGHDVAYIAVTGALHAI